MHPHRIFSAVSTATHAPLGLRCRPPCVYYMFHPNLRPHLQAQEAVAQCEVFEWPMAEEKEEDAQIGEDAGPSDPNAAAMAAAATAADGESILEDLTRRVMQRVAEPKPTRDRRLPPIPGLQPRPPLFPPPPAVPVACSAPPPYLFFSGVDRLNNNSIPIPDASVLRPPTRSTPLSKKNIQVALLLQEKKEVLGLIAKAEASATQAVRICDHAMRAFSVVHDELQDCAALRARLTTPHPCASRCRPLHACTHATRYSCACFFHICAPASNPGASQQS